MDERGNMKYENGAQAALAFLNKSCRRPAFIFHSSSFFAKYD